LARKQKNIQQIYDMPLLTFVFPSMI